MMPHMGHGQEFPAVATNDIESAIASKYNKFSWHLLSTWDHFLKPFQTKQERKVLTSESLTLVTVTSLKE